MLPSQCHPREGNPPPGKAAAGKLATACSPPQPNLHIRPPAPTPETYIILFTSATRVASLRSRGSVPLYFLKRARGRPAASDPLSPEGARAGTVTPSGLGSCLVKLFSRPPHSVPRTGVPLPTTFGAANPPAQSFSPSTGHGFHLFDCWPPVSTLPLPPSNVSACEPGFPFRYCCTLGA